MLKHIPVILCMYWLLSHRPPSYCTVYPTALEGESFHLENTLTWCQISRIGKDAHSYPVVGFFIAIFVVTLVVIQYMTSHWRGHHLSGESQVRSWKKLSQWNSLLTSDWVCWNVFSARRTFNIAIYYCRDPTKTRLVYIIHSYLGGRIPNRVADLALPSLQLSFISSLNKTLKDNGALESSSVTAQSALATASPRVDAPCS